MQPKRWHNLERKRKTRKTWTLRAPLPLRRFLDFVVDDDGGDAGGDGDDAHNKTVAVLSQLRGHFSEYHALTKTRAKRRLSLN
jgi:hypothetical protein